MYVFSYVLRAHDLLSCELRHVAVELWVHLLCFYPLQVHVCTALSLVYDQFLGEILSV